ncbi:unnamed protein product [Mytilus coruscus]|uniref:YqaJ viral recombinase domain-containing protein n=1 Tax=Mytilus coruscus TaxID=42192 RepID=A0A6J8A081_MYTCO|nr:unnamed protein product [Mytilus coruscus]
MESPGVDPILCKHTAKYTLDAAKPGLLDLSLKIVSEKLKGEKDVKLSIDGKKLASGFGKLGNEDLGGHETAPILQERQVRLDAERREFDTKKEIVKATSDENEHDATITKQRSDEWFRLREKSRLTGSTFYKGLGLRKLKDQQTHYDKVNRGKEPKISKDLQDLFDYGTEQEINALGTLLGKIMPVYFPNLTYKEDGCKVINLNDSYAVISGDGSGIDQNHSNKVAFEVKCPKPGKNDQQTEQSIKPEECKIDFAVPSDPILCKHTAKYTLDAAKPGLLDLSLKIVSEKLKGEKDVKLSIDGKKLASGFGKLGNEDLGGHETAPILQERQVRLDAERREFDTKKEIVKKATSDENEHDATITKQRSDEWFRLREKSRLTGSTFYKGLGLRKLKDQQTHYDKVNRGKEPKISKDLQDLFDDGTEQEINALGTLLGKIMPVYFPNLTYKEDGCKIINLNDSYAVISGDGSGIDQNHSNKVAFEFKCPKPGKQRPTDVHYTLPKYYSAQVLSQMFAKKSSSFTYISFSPDSTVFIDGKTDFDLWGTYGKWLSKYTQKTQRDQQNVMKKDQKRFKRYALPIQYGLSGFSLTMLSVRNILKDAVSACTEKELYVKAIAFDGQVLEISVEDDKGIPLTVLRFIKKLWEKVQHIDKVEKVSHLIGLNNLNAIQSHQDLTENFDIQGNSIGLKLHHKVVASGINIRKALDRKTRQNERAQEDKELKSTIDNEIYL